MVTMGNIHHRLLRFSILKTCRMVPIRIDKLLGLFSSGIGTPQNSKNARQDTRSSPRILALSIRNESM